MTKQMKLEEIADIRTGQVLSRKIAKGEIAKIYRVFQLSSIEKDGTICDSSIDTFNSKTEIDSKLLTKEGDILIRLSNPYTSVYIEKKYENILIPSLIAVIRMKLEEILPEYVKIYLNSEKAKEQIRKEANGTVIETINTKSLKNIQIPIPTLEKQYEIAKLAEIYIEEKKLSEKLIQLKEKEFESILEEAIKN